MFAGMSMVYVDDVLDLRFSWVLEGGVRRFGIVFGLGSKFGVFFLRSSRFS